jgi:hypothetical protein
MRRLFAIACASLIACACHAAPPILPMYAHMGNSTVQTVTTANVVGYVEEITVSVVGGVVTGFCEVAYLPADGVSGAVQLGTNSVTASKTYRPRVDATDAVGDALTSDPPVRYYLYGDTLRFIVSASPTNKTWRADIKLSNR